MLANDFSTSTHAVAEGMARRHCTAACSPLLATMARVRPRQSFYILLRTHSKHKERRLGHVELELGGGNGGHGSGCGPRVLTLAQTTTKLGRGCSKGHSGVVAAMDWSEVRWLFAATAAARLVVPGGKEQLEGEQASEWEREAADAALGFASPTRTHGRRGTRSLGGGQTQFRFKNLIRS
jgi:hypothetical protein